MNERIIVGADWRKYITTEPKHKEKREWQGLTDEERDEICLGDEAIAHAVEAKLREKNNGRV